MATTKLTDKEFHELQQTRDNVSTVRDAVDKLYLQSPYLLTRTEWTRIRDILDNTAARATARINADLGI